MLSQTLSFYFARHFARIVIALFILILFVIAMASCVEFFSRAFKGDAVFGLDLALLALFRVPSVSEDTLPFVVLYGSIAAFIIANRRLEVVVTRAAGVSAWQFLIPASAVGLLFGVLATTVYNPISSELLARSQRAHLQRVHQEDIGRPQPYRQAGVDAAEQWRHRFDHRRPPVV